MRNSDCAADSRGTTTSFVTGTGDRLDLRRGARAVRTPVRTPPSHRKCLRQDASSLRASSRRTRPAWTSTAGMHRRGTPRSRPVSAVEGSRRCQSRDARTGACPYTNRRNVCSATAGRQILQLSKAIEAQLPHAHELALEQARPRRPCRPAAPRRETRTASAWSARSPSHRRRRRRRSQRRSATTHRRRRSR